MTPNRDNNGSLRILGIHGIWNYKPDNNAERFAKFWASALQPNLPCPADVAVTYYADLLRDPSKPTRQSQPSAALDDLDVVERALADGWVDTIRPEIGNKDAVAQGYLTAGVRWVISQAARRFNLDKVNLERLLGMFFPEVRRYLTPEIAIAVQDRFISDLKRHRPTVVFAHSLGSVVAFESLWRVYDEQPDLRVPLLVTLGSPLAMPGPIRERLGHVCGVSRMKRPANVDRWVNIADVGDVIAVPQGLANYFGDVEDIDTVISAFDFHKVANYLSDPRIGEILAQTRGADLATATHSGPSGPAEHPSQLSGDQAPALTIDEPNGSANQEV